MSDPVLQVSGLGVTFPGLFRSTSILRGVDFEVAAGEVLGLVGESGCGKSMTASACLGMVPPPGCITGSIRIDGQEVIGRPESELRAMRGSRVAMIFQNPMRSMNPFFTLGRQMIDVICCHRPVGRREARTVALSELKAVRIPDPELALQKYPHQLSGGQIQRALIALALACQPRLLIADEPTTALDVTIQAQIVWLLRRLADEKGLAVVFITHDLGIVSQLCDRVAVMYAGRIVEMGSVEGVIDQPRHPYTAKLLGTVPVVGRGTGDLVSIPGHVPDPGVIPTGCAFHDRCDRATGICAEADPPARTFGEGHLALCHHAVRHQQVTEAP
ncbi:ABC transporter ATP-binding protein [Mesorhizobium sp. M7A.F.Ca.CA.001.09.2.1]|uniref:ABC transporter ATP-binding protein n=1 Tax=Mesorhizobium ciceri TaxID=39645 RepID=A0AB38TDQ2_9HYPH|nr:MULTISPECIES: ABC transporter ATP-binding protein [Mesorhizobium]MDF3218268.1 ABC transporter ATP-binding protein [Mesorhizobium ciceri]RUY71323.1 ABC transporter ATP-binding protein [Mesorhizobium sp. M7A.F.Ca.CA.001.13.1.1]RUY74428.1 ABC transporter ATP-binding protein [Mesorhizobium sp. M7A.F.Ca.CA.001.05.1.1]RUY80596.1 ABC transporter ATP-binding protein [Mesorhizobium sp. M7A.F.Ca.CA.001.09.2.1]RUZ06741.1 ABC transporter ATP-binding protein [Mesorhizobium sp. M7A.F.Ca.CA.001.04.2.1]